LELLWPTVTITIIPISIATATTAQKQSGLWFHVQALDVSIKLNWSSFFYAATGRNMRRGAC
jgi:hypothetical protein